MSAEIHKILVCSTAHLTVATLAMLNETAAEHWGFSGNPIDHGFFLYAHDERPDYGGEAYGYRPCPDDIWALCVKARELGADYIKLDCDAEEVEGLEVYDHDAPDAEDDNPFHPESPEGRAWERGEGREG